MAPADENECRQMLFTAFQMDSPVAVRYPRGTGPGVEIQQAMRALPIGKGQVRREGAAAAGSKSIAILAFGGMLQPSLAAAEALNATVANMRFVKPLDEELAVDLARRHDLVVTVEENVIAGGAGSAVIEALQRHGVTTPVLQLGLPDRFVDQGDPGVQIAACGLTTDGITQSVRTRLGLS
jgi:1-deoxy-D-xylulose-5-phosphate synthase